MVTNESTYSQNEGMSNVIYLEYAGYTSTITKVLLNSSVINDLKD